MAFYGAVMSTFMTDEISPHVIQTVLSTVVHGIGHIFGFGGPPPVIGT
jgi:predicted Zn-dependent protease with MMP-like domain